MIRLVTVSLTAALLLSGCVNNSQSRYGYQDVGKAAVVEFGVIIASRPVDISGRNSGAGALVGGTAGGFAMSGVGNGTGNAAAIVGGIIVGAAAGAIAEQAMSDRTGLEYTITLNNGKTVTLVQEQTKEDRVFAPGERVMVQANGTYQRVLAADHLPTEVTRPKGITVVD